MERIARIERMQGDESEWHSLSELVPSRDPQPLRPPMVTLRSRRAQGQDPSGDVLGALTRTSVSRPAQIGKIHVNEFRPASPSSRRSARTCCAGSRGQGEGKRAVKVRRL